VIITRLPVVGLVKALSDSQIAAFVELGCRSRGGPRQGRWPRGERRPATRLRALRRAHQFDRQTLPALAALIANISSHAQPY
jgi:hypothetical protein